MILCPNCGKSLAEDAAHCGHCGHKMDLDNKKTMLGMAAINAAELQRNIAEAKAAAAAEDGASEAPSDTAADKPKLKLPTPGQGPSTGSAGGFSLPKPSLPSPSSEAASSEAGDDVDGEAKTIMIPKINKPGEGPSEDQALASSPKDTLPESPPDLISAPSAESPAQPSSFTTEPMEAAPGASPAAADNFASTNEDAFAETIAGQTAEQLAAQGQPLNPAGNTPAGNTPAGPVPDTVPTGAPAGPGLDPYSPSPEMMVQPDQAMAQVPGGDLVPGSEEGKSKKKLFMIIGGIAAVLFGCCILGNVINFVLGMMG